MPLIDQYELLERLEREIDITEYSCFPAVESGLYLAEQIVREMRTVNDGENTFWTLDGKCSRCGYKVAKSIGIRNFCPKCGADMRKAMKNGRK